MFFPLLICLALPACIPAQRRVLGIQEGSECKQVGGVSWVCTHAKRCPQIGDVRVARHEICSFQDLDPIICCPPPVKMRLSKAIAKCDEYRKQLCNGPTSEVFMRRKRETEVNDTTTEMPESDLGMNPPELTPDVHHVMGGIQSIGRTHAHMAMIGYGKKDDKKWGCGGSLVSPRYVLSAAHCAQTLDGPARWARLGDLDITSTTDDASPQDFTIVERIIHPDYSKELVYSDIALFKLNKEVVFTNWVRPTCLWTNPTIMANRATVTGWGRVEFVGATSPHLMEVELPIVDGPTCKDKMGVSKKYPDGINISTMVCAGEKDGGKDACLGDSGGPLVVPATANCLKMQIGITSFGKMCGLPDTPGVYTRVSFFLPWIESIVWPN